MKTKEEILASKGITLKTKHHSYEYLYRSILKAMDEYIEQLDTKDCKADFMTINAKEFNKWAEQKLLSKKSSLDLINEIYKNIGIKNPNNK